MNPISGTVQCVIVEYNKLNVAIIINIQYYAKIKYTIINNVGSLNKVWPVLKKNINWLDLI